MRLLVIEDDPDLNRQLATALTDAGYVVDRAFDGEAVPLASAVKAVQGRGRQVVRALFCHETKGLVYLLTVLAPDGKVTHTAVDATSGKVVEVR